MEVLGAAEGAGASRRGARAKSQNRDFWRKKLSAGSSELRVATHMYKIYFYFTYVKIWTECSKKKLDQRIFWLKSISEQRFFAKDIPNLQKLRLRRAKMIDFNVKYHYFGKIAARRAAKILGKIKILHT